MKRNDRDRKTGSFLEKFNGDRRIFLKGLIASGAGGVSSILLRPNPGMASGGAAIQKNRKSGVEQRRKVPIVEDVDVLVVGGGMAGVGAAVAAAQAKAAEGFQSNFLFSLKIKKPEQSGRGNAR